MRLIDADALIEEIQSVYVEEKSEDPKWAIGLRYSKHIVRNMPTVEQQPKTGRWISVPHKKARICNRCEADEPYKFADDDADVYDYCPHCGAKMVE